MSGRWFPTIYVASLVSFLCIFDVQAENARDEGSSYDVGRFVTEISRLYDGAVRLREFGQLDSFEFGGVLDDEFDFQRSGNSSQNSTRCRDDVLYAIHNIKSQWSLKLFDSFGKPESGILQGNVKWIGDYEECIEVRAWNHNSSTIGNYRGKYCTVTFSVKLLKLPIPFNFSSAICVPDSCSEEELPDILFDLLRAAGIKINLNPLVEVNSLICKSTERHLNTPAKAVISLIVILTLFSVIGSSITAWKYCKKIIHGFTNPSLFIDTVDHSYLIENYSDSSLIKDEPGEKDVAQEIGDAGLLQKLDSFFSCFCVFTNGAKVLNTDVPEGELLCIHGIRFLSMSWVILGHAYMTGIEQIKNMLDLMKYVDGFLFQIVLQGFYSVDSFFVLSGFLLAYLSMKEFAKTKGRIAWPYFYIHRYIRLTPIYMVILGFFTTVYLYLGSGPYWLDGNVDKNCQKDWWKNLIYINNFDDQKDQCMAWSWYLANDMQFFIISPLFLISLWRWPKVGYSLIGIFLLASCLANFFITYHFELMAGVFNLSQAAMTSLTKYMDYFNKIYIKPYTRIGPYLIGILTGYILFKKKAAGNFRHSLVFLISGWTIASAITLPCVFGLYHSNPSNVGNSFYNALNRTGFAIGLAWIIYVCLIGQGGIVNRILSYKFFIPLSRLTYTAYLIHPMIMTGYFTSLRAPILFNHPTMVFLFLGFMVVTYALSLPVALVLESPVVSLEKLVRSRFVKKQGTEALN